MQARQARPILFSNETYTPSVVALSTSGLSWGWDVGIALQEGIVKPEDCIRNIKVSLAVECHGDGSEELKRHAITLRNKINQLSFLEQPVTILMLLKSIFTAYLDYIVAYIKKSTGSSEINISRIFVSSPQLFTTRNSQILVDAVKATKYTENVTCAPEADCAAIAFLMERELQGPRTDERFLVIDGGGLTVDLGSYHIDKPFDNELAPSIKRVNGPSSAMIGSLHVNQAIREWCFGKEGSLEVCQARWSPCVCTN